MAIFSGSSRHSSDSSGRRYENAGLTIIAAGTLVVGDVASEGVVKVEGEIRGSVRAAGQLLIAKGGIIHGDVLTREAVIGGEIEGAVRAEERVEIQSGAVVNGDIMTQRILIAEGGKVNGQLSMAAGDGLMTDIGHTSGSEADSAVSGDSHNR
jgi:cytoskeletal protein CcmA (bactofilin family)